VKVKLKIGDDDLVIECGPSITRPVHISRARWRAFWNYIAFRGLDIAMMDRFMEGEKPMPERRSNPRS